MNEYDIFNESAALCIFLHATTAFTFFIKIDFWEIPQISEYLRKLLECLGIWEIS